MAYSQNGYSAKKSNLIATYTVPGTKVKVSLRKGDASVVLLYLMKEYHRTVQPLRQSDTGGYNPRSVVGGRSLSNHASGTAVDLRWRDHWQGQRNTFSSSQVKAFRKILAYLEGAVRWGGDYSGTKDEMHWEIIASPSKLKRIADKIRKGASSVPVQTKPTQPPTSTVPKFPGVMRKGMKSAGVKAAQARLKARGWAITVDGDFGPGTEKVVKAFQADKKLAVDGIIGPQTWAAMWTAPVTK